MQNYGNLKHIYRPEGDSCPDSEQAWYLQNVSSPLIRCVSEYFKKKPHTKSE